MHFPSVLIFICFACICGAAKTAADLCSIRLIRPAFCFFASLASSGNAFGIVRLLHIPLQSFCILSLASSGVILGSSVRRALYIFGMYSRAVNANASALAFATLNKSSYLDTVVHSCIRTFRSNFCIDRNRLMMMYITVCATFVNYYLRSPERHYYLYNSTVRPHILC